jgi:hypothetical protein
MGGRRFIHANGLGKNNLPPRFASQHPAQF